MPDNIGRAEHKVQRGQHTYYENPVDRSETLGAIATHDFLDGYDIGGGP
jgi:hypothetical protein